jgi:hypothetical protein
MLGLVVASLLDDSADGRAQVLALDRTRGAFAVNAVVKTALAVSFFVAIVIGPASVEGKAMGFRAPLFLAPAVLVPIVARRRGSDPYPHTGDALLSAPFLVDTFGNLFGFYDEFPVTDDVLHLVNWVLLVGAYHAFRFRRTDSRVDALFLGYGFGAVAIVWWEVLEWAVSEDGFGGAGGLALTYQDTVIDLFLSSTGGLIGSALGVALLGPARTGQVPKTGTPSA